jgi:hypothetical protein
VDLYVGIELLPPCSGQYDKIHPWRLTPDDWNEEGLFLSVWKTKVKFSYRADVFSIDSRIVKKLCSFDITQ